ncbi:MMPL family transporter [Heyndrickxia acidiproducens]|uniref:MMPL family transporter n=1 Tax=Heyndrickxia acidiproducens TaxID=1121084 RepID=UPI0003A4A7B7|nr:MMPL family transporter [Heyndrickxia acidiproducens]
MKRVVQFKWVILLLWITAGILFAWKAPAMEPLVREKGQINVPEGYASSLANEIKSRHSAAGTGGTNVILVFHRESRLTDTYMDRIKATIGRLENRKQQLSIQTVTSPFKQPLLKSQLISKDGKTVMAVLKVDPGQRSFKTVRTQLNKEIKTPGVQAMMTGNRLINEDVADSSQTGLKKTEVITVIFIQKDWEKLRPGFMMPVPI